MALIGTVSASKQARRIGTARAMEVGASSGDENVDPS
jgi:hypothetical protein